jgi:hypothetical protein
MKTYRFTQSTEAIHEAVQKLFSKRQLHTSNESFLAPAMQNRIAASAI